MRIDLTYKVSRLYSLSIREETETKNCEQWTVISFVIPISLLAVYLLGSFSVSMTERRRKFFQTKSARTALGGTIFNAAQGVVHNFFIQTINYLGDVVVWFHLESLFYV